MRILQVVPALNSGGVERCVIDISNYLVSQGHDVFVISSGGWMEMLLDKTCQHTKRDIGAKNPYKILKNARFLKNFCEKNNIDLVCVHSRAPAWACAIAKKTSKFKLITVVHGVYSTKGLFKKKYNSIMFSGDKVIAVSDFLKNHIIQEYGVAENLIRVIPPGVDSSIFSCDKVSHQRVKILCDQLNIPDDKYIITVPARITEIKGHENLIKALSVINSNEYLCLLAGDWTGKEVYKKKLVGMINKFKLESKVRFVSSVRDMAALYLISDLVILPSIKPESFGRVIIEAGAMGRVMLVTALGNPKDIIHNGINGFLVQPFDHIIMSRKIVDIMQSNIHQDEAYKTRVARHFSEEFSVHKSCEAQMQIYYEVILYQ